MMPSAESLKNDILKLKPTSDKLKGNMNLAGVICDFMSKIQAGPLGQPGILKANKTVMGTILSKLPPVPDKSWAVGFAAAWAAGIIAGQITPGTVKNPAWVGSGGSDVLTLPLTVATIITLALATVALAIKLATGDMKKNAPLPMAQAIHDA